MQCKCNGSKKVMVNQGLGCTNGGYSDCPKWYNLFCSDGTNIGNPTEMMKWRIRTSEERRKPGYKGCACSDRIMPRFVIINTGLLKKFYSNQVMEQKQGI